MGEEQANWKVYAPKQFLFGQAGGSSDIVSQETPRKTWSEGKPQTIILLNASRGVVAELRTNHGWWGGAQRDAVTDIDVGLRDLFAAGGDVVQSLAAWINLVGGETDGILAVVHPQATVDVLSRATTRPIQSIKAATVADALTQYETYSRNIT